MMKLPQIFDKLQNFGLSEQYVRSIGLHRWWDDKLNNNPIAVLEGSGHICSRLGLDLKSLLNETEELKYAFVPSSNIFAPNSIEDRNVLDGICLNIVIADEIAKVIAKAIKNKYWIPHNPLLITDELKSRFLTSFTPHNYELPNLLNYCWEHGIGVMYFTNYPSVKGLSEGSIHWSNGHPVIMLSNKSNINLCVKLIYFLGCIALGRSKPREEILVECEIDIETKGKDDPELDDFMFHSKYTQMTPPIEFLETMERNLDWNVYGSPYRDDVIYLQDIIEFEINKLLKNN